MSDDAKVRLADDDVRDAFRTELDTSFVIEAGAGTGKTTLIIDRILGHVLRGDPIESIVAITFTEKAAAELKTRVRRALESRLGATSGAARTHVAEALRRVDAAQIRTIHSFAQSLILERPVEARIDPGAVIAEASAIARLRGAAFEAELEALKDEPEFEREVADLLASGVSLEKLEEIAELAVNARDLPIEDPHVEPSCAAPPLAALSAAVEKMRDLVASGLKARSDKLAEAIEVFARDVERISGLDPRTASRELFQRVPRSASRVGNKTNWRSADALERTREEWSALEGVLETWKSGLRCHRAAVAWRFARRVASRFERMKLEQGILDFDDLLIRARDLLRDHVPVRRSFASRFRTLIVDEFQDTDPLQAEIAFFLAEEEGGAASDWRQVRVGKGRLVIVGDPKQSIYGFRRADIQVYEEAKRLLERSGGKVRAIRVNFRSAAPILDFANELFSRLIARDPDHTDEQPEYIALEAKPNSEPGAPCVVVLEEPGSHEFPSNRSRRTEAEATALSAYLKRIVSGPEPRRVRDRDSGRFRAPRWSDVAILFRTTSHHAEFESALSDAGIPYRIAGGRRFFDRVEVKSAIALLRALDDPSDEVALLGTLRGPFFSISDRDLADFVARGGRLSEIEAHDAASPALGSAFRRILNLREKRHGRSIAGFVEEALATVRAHPIFLLHRDGEARAANLDKLISIARSLEADEALGFRGYVDEVSRRVRETEKEADAEFLDEDDDAVTLITMHTSKGLEWPIVCIADLGSKGRAIESRFVIRAPSPAVEFAMGSSKCFRAETAGFAAARHGAQRRGIYERRRLLYVAMTRARDLLVLTRYHSPPPKDAKTDSDPNSRPAIDEYRDDPFFCGLERRDYGERVDATSLDRFEPIDEPLRVDLKLGDAAPREATEVLAERASFVETSRASFARSGTGRAVTSATAEKAKSTSDERDDDAPRARTHGVRGVAFGTFVHAIFERIDWKAGSGPDPAVVRALARENDLDDAAIDAAVRLLADFLDSPLAHELRRAKRILAETPFAFRQDGTLFEGAIDLIAEREDGGLWIVDWKTDDVSGADLETRFEAYRSQAGIYRRAVTEATGRAPTRVVFHFLRRGESREA